MVKVRWLLTGFLLALTSCASEAVQSWSLPPGSGPFLTGSDVQSLTGFRIARTDDHPASTPLPITEWPIDNHGPCSNNVQPPAVSAQTEYRYFVSVSGGGAELVGPADAAYTAFLDALHNDVSAPCDGFTFDDESGGTRSVTDVRLLDVSDLEPSAIAWSSHSSGGAFPATEDFNFAMISNGEFVFGGIQAVPEAHGDRLPSDAKLRALVELAVKRLTA